MGFLDNSELEIEKKDFSPQEIAKKYSVILSFNDNKLSADLVSNSKDQSRFFIKNDLKYFSNEQKLLLKDIRDLSAWEEEIDIERFFKRLEKSFFSIYFKTEEKITKVFLDKKNEEKISLKFYLASGKIFFPQREGDYIFEVGDQNFFQKNFKYFLLTEKRIFYLKDNFIFQQKISSNIAPVFQRILKKEYDSQSSFFSEKFQTKLNEREILKINSIIEEAQNDFNLESKLRANFQIKEYKKLKTYLEIYFNQKENFLEIKPMVDYGIKKFNIAKTVYRASSKGESYFLRRAGAEFTSEYIFQEKDNQILFAKINQELEIVFFKEIYSFHRELGFSKALTLKKQGARQIASFLDRNWDNFEKYKKEKRVVYLKDKLDIRELEFYADLDVKYHQENRNNLLAFDANFYLGKNKISLEQLKNYDSGKDKFLINEKGDLVEIKNKKELERFLELLEAFEQNKESGKFEGKLYSAFELENIFTSSKYYKANFDQGFKKFLNEARGGKVIEKVNLEKDYNFLRAYQKDGINWMYFLKKYNFGGILADDMGLGKTIQALVMLEKNKIKKKPSIVIVPKTLIGNWKTEAEKFAKKSKVLVIAGSEKERIELIKKAKNYDILITSYSFFQRDAELYKKEEIYFNYAVLDEAQYIKNFRTKNAQVVKEINAQYRLALSGTPLENSVSEIWSIFEFLMPGFLGKYSAFAKKYINPIKNNSDLTKMRDLQAKISIFVLRRTKDSVLKELPAKTINTLKLELSNDQSILYQQVLSNLKKDLFDRENKFSKSYIHILAALTKLRQICNHPNLILKKEDYSKYQSAKLDIFLNLVKEIESEGRKVLVFSQFKTMLDILKKELDREGIKNISLTGESKNRDQLIDSYNQNKDLTVFLISLKAGGVGLNLTSADNVILFDPWWNPSAEKQAIDRTHRIGQDKKVNVYKLITKGTIEEKIMKMQEKKRGLFDTLVNESEESLKNISWEDLKTLFD